jgi:hypothetical protein
VLLHEGLERAVGTGYESFAGLGVAVLTAARFEEWTAMLDTSRRALTHQIRTGGLGVIYVAAILNVVAFTLASKQPEGAAVIQGSVKTLLKRLSADIAAPVRGDSSEQNDVARYVVAVRQETTRRLTVVLGADRVRELRAQGPPWMKRRPTPTHAIASTSISTGLPLPACWGPTQQSSRTVRDHADTGPVPDVEFRCSPEIVRRKCAFETVKEKRRV